MLRHIRRGAAVVAAIFAVLPALCSAAAAGVPQAPEARSGAASWPYPDHDPSNSRLAAGSPITAKELSRLTTAWKVAATGGLPTSPIVVGHNVFVEDQVAEIFDIDLTSGRVVWKSPSNGYSVGPEGVAVGWGKVFGVTPTSLFALDENTGRQLWSTRLTRTATDGVDVQPQVIGRDVIASTVPVSVKGIYIGGDRGFVDAVGESSGKLLWGFDTVASPSLWGNPSVNSGGGSWYPPSFSPTLGLLYVGIANPAPFVGTTQYPNGSSRPGSNLYTDSTVALRITNGKLLWYHQANAHDLLDRDFVHTMIVQVPSADGRPGADRRRGYRQGLLCHRDGSEEWQTVVADAGRDPQERQLEGAHRADGGPSGNLRWRADASRVSERNGVRGCVERRRTRCTQTKPSISAGRQAPCRGRSWRWTRGPGAPCGTPISQATRPVA